MVEFDVRSTCHCHREEDATVVLPVVVASETEARGGRKELLKLLDCAGTVAAAAVFTSSLPELEKKAGLELLETELRRESSRW